MPTRLNARMMGRRNRKRFPGTGASQPKYIEIMTAMKTQSRRMNLPCVIR